MFTAVAAKIIYVIAIFLLSFLFANAYRRFLKLFKSKSLTERAKPNIGTSDRLFRLFLAVILLVWGIYTWSALALFFSGFCFYEAFAKWCGFYAALGRNTCPL